MNDKVKSADVPDSETIVKYTQCPKCEQYVEIAVKHMLTKVESNRMAREAMEFNLTIGEIPLLEWRKNTDKFGCKCANQTSIK